MELKGTEDMLNTVERQKIESMNRVNMVSKDDNSKIL